MAIPLNLLISLPCAKVPLSEWGPPKISANQPTKTQRTQRELKTCLYFTANWGFSLWSGSAQPKVLKARWFSINTDFQGQLCRILSLKLSIHPHPLGKSNSHEFLVFCGPYAHIGINDSWLSDRLTANIFFPLLISKRAINLETTASGRRIKACHRSSVIISVIVSWCCWACCCKEKKISTQSPYHLNG